MTATLTRAEVEAHIAKLSPEARARAEHIDTAPRAARDATMASLIRVERPAGWKEKDEQREIFRLLRALGWQVLWLSQAQRSQQTTGLPDLLARHHARGLLLWCEVKRPEEPSEYTPAQRAFASDRLPCEHYVMGTEGNVRQYLASQDFELPSPSYPTYPPQP